MLVDAVVMVEMAGGACFGLLVGQGARTCGLRREADLTSSIAATTQSVVNDALAFVWPECVLWWGKRRGVEKVRRVSWKRG